MLRKTPWTSLRSSPKLKLRVGAQASLIALSVLFISACSTPQTGGSAHTIQSAHSNDIWQRVRDKFGMPELENSEVAARENYYTTRADYVGRMATRSADFLYLIMDEVERRRMPSELALLPFVESAFVTSAKSSAAASGLWQFMPATGRDFSLQQNRFADQRNDVIASTNAALDYLQRLYNMYGDWHLALAAYNWGQGNVSRAVNRSLSAGGSGKYTDINMPLETRQYVPKLQAIKNIVRNPSQYGISLPSIPNRLRHEAILVTRDIDVSKAAELANLSEEEFKRINPAYKKPIIVAALNSRILVPADRADDFRRAFSDHSRQLASLTTYTTYSTEALADIASKYNTDENRLRELNSIPYNHSYVRADSTLIVPRTRKNDEISYLALNSSVRSITGGVGITDYNTYTDGDTPTLVVANSGKTSTGLVANTGSADQLSTLISAAPSTPAYVPSISPVESTQTRLADKRPSDLLSMPPVANSTSATRVVDKGQTDLLTMPPVAKASTMVDQVNDPIAQITQGSSNTASATRVNNLTDITKASETTPVVSADAIAPSAPSVTPASKPIAPKLSANNTPTYSTDSIIIPETDSALTTPVVTAPNQGLSTTDKLVLAAAVASATTTAKEPTPVVTKTSYRQPSTPVIKTRATPALQTPASKVVAHADKATRTALKASPIAKAVANKATKDNKPTPAPVQNPVPLAKVNGKNTSKDYDKTSAKISAKASVKASLPSKPEPKKAESKALAATSRPTSANTTQTTVRQQTPQKSGTTGKIVGKAEVQAPIKGVTSKTPVKPPIKPVASASASTSKASNTGKTGSSVILPKKK